ncbi:hypothetical protein [Phyllobacterium brassicacearum]|uniref:hypothetical protein n=1 Tax=Phyllobacterium brassicacearum TaxID=314235 RepID=UPI0010DD5E8F|nr:hypothetical protein [Phyllobacterium brassicacearum]TDQ33848.1 hypothetical protein DEV91_10449 [Phyllobacterium brassicacearum]
MVAEPVLNVAEAMKTAFQQELDPVLTGRSLNGSDEGVPDAARLHMLIVQRQITVCIKVKSFVGKLG